MPDKDFSIQKTAEPMAPVHSGERITELDVLRGFAMMGVLLAYALWNLGNAPEETYSQAQFVLNKVLGWLIDTKAYTTLATLFGLGFSIQLVRARSRGINIVPVYCRRLSVLLLIGLAHALLLRNGDILVPYATMGFLLLLFRNASNRTILVGAIAALIFPFIAEWLWSLTGVSFPERPVTDNTSYIAENLAWVRYWYSIAILQWTPSLTLFLFGLYLGRKRLFENIAAHKKVIWGGVIGGLSLGLIALVGVEWLNRADAAPFFGQRIAARLLWTFHAWGMAAFYASSLILLLQKEKRQKRLAPLGAVGRMALTNYIWQAALIVPVCIGFRLFDTITPVSGLILALGVAVLQIPFSVWWLKHFEFGPIEWFWRRLTYGRVQSAETIERRESAAII
ncbi:MAG TPA: DUF418 domain-containing protein [Pyrinomonadaceae bacterium]|jgi:uncharacterized protein